MTPAPAIVADCLVNLFGAVGALVLAFETQRQDPRGPMTRRISFALRFVAVMFLVRSLAWSMESALALRLADVLAALTPLVSLFVAEGLIRRHAQRAMKWALIAGPLLLVAAKALPFVPMGAVSALLIVTVVGGYASIAALLWTRETGGLTDAENASVWRVLLAMLVLAPLIVTDFRSIWPDVPVRLGAMGALLVLYLGFGSGNLRASAGERAATVLGFGAIAALLALGYGAANGWGELAQMFRAGVVALSGLLCAAIFSESRGARGERNRPLDPLLRARTPAAFEAGLAAHPLLSGARLLSGADLDHVRHPAFRTLLEETGVLRRDAAPWGRPGIDDGVERALSLMTAHDATDLVLLTAEPLRVLAVALPPIARDARSESDIHLARLAGEIAFARSATS
jgi:hypothetical protein